jgi:hypothetical protein
MFVSYTIKKIGLWLDLQRIFVDSLSPKIMILNGHVDARSGAEMRYLDRANHTEVHTPKPVTNQDTPYGRQPKTIHEMNIMLMVGIKTGS